VSLAYLRLSHFQTETGFHFTENALRVRLVDEIGEHDVLVFHRLLDVVEPHQRLEP
jgi:hypothetical protein